jgi:hypothetical protein
LVAIGNRPADVIHVVRIELQQWGR